MTGHLKNSIRLRAPLSGIRGTISLPSSKSLSNRALVMEFLAGKSGGISNLSDAGDTLVMKQCLERIAEFRGSSSPVIIDAGNAGTVMRFLAAVLSITEGQWLLTGSQRMLERPVGALADALLSLGADIAYGGRPGYPPLLINGKELRGGAVSIQSQQSSQFISALLMIAPLLENGLKLKLEGTPVSAPYIDMTLGLMEHYGIRFSYGLDDIEVSPGHYIARPLAVESDWSAASYWYNMLALAGEGELLLSGLQSDSLQGDRLVAELYRSFGVNTSFTREGAHMVCQGVAVDDFCFSFRHHPDLAQAVAVTAAGLGIPARLEGLQTLRIKETDRITALQVELAKTGATITVDGDTLVIAPSIKPITPFIEFDTWDDHRMAMALAALAFKSGEVIIHNPEVVEKSYPGFWDELRSVGF